MKKNNMLRIASVLLVAVLLSTCAISGAFAKYTTFGDATFDQARVANFGVTISPAATLDIASATYNKDGDHAIAVVVNAGEDEVMAPGTTYDLTNAFTFSEDDREVAVRVSYKAELTLTGWDIDGVEYCPLVFTINTQEYAIGTQTVAEFEAAVEQAINNTAAFDVAIGTDIATATQPTISWTWDFEGDDAKDTAMGQDATKATVDLKLTATVDQLN